MDDFGPLLRQEALRRGYRRAGQVVVLIGGAVGLGNMATLAFPDCVQIVDFFHAMEHAGRVIEAFIGKDHPEYRPRLRRWAKRLLKDKVENLIEEIRCEGAGKPNEVAVEGALHYFATNVKRMQYGTFRKVGYFIGSGVVEAGCKTVIGARCKQSGMFWSESGAENILAFRCIHASRRLDQFWKYRLKVAAAQNDCFHMTGYNGALPPLGIYALRKYTSHGPQPINRKFVSHPPMRGRGQGSKYFDEPGNGARLRGVSPAHEVTPTPVIRAAVRPRGGGVRCGGRSGAGCQGRL